MYHTRYYLIESVVRYNTYTISESSRYNIFEK